VLTKECEVLVKTISGPLVKLDLEQGIRTPKLEADELIAEVGDHLSGELGGSSMLGGVPGTLVVLAAEVVPDIVGDQFGRAFVSAKKLADDLATHGASAGGRVFGVS
jgi:hypothetical protein